MDTINCKNHSKIDQDEFIAKKMVEELTKKKFIKRESPDLCSEDGTIGVEVTRANPAAFEKYVGEERTRISNPEKHPEGAKSFHANLTDDDCVACLKDAIVNKTKMLTKYYLFDNNYLYITTLIGLNIYAPQDFLEKVINAVSQEFENDTSALFYDKILILFNNKFIVVDWNTWGWKCRDDIFQKHDEFLDMAKAANSN